MYSILILGLITLLVCRYHDCGMVFRVTNIVPIELDIPNVTITLTLSDSELTLGPSKKYQTL